MCYIRRKMEENSERNTAEVLQGHESYNSFYVSEISILSKCLNLGGIICP